MVQDELREERVDGRMLYDGRILRLEVDRVRMPNGVETIREVVRHPGAAVVVPLLADGRVVLVRQFRYPAGRVFLEAPAGKLAWGGEDPLACARRELEEETGYRARTWRPLTAFFSAPGFTDERMHCFLATDLEQSGRSSPDHDECIQVATLPLEEAVARVRRGELDDGKTIIALLLAAALLAGNPQR
jgi:ADP-ribose pyrophosphatase